MLNIHKKLKYIFNKYLLHIFVYFQFDALKPVNFQKNSKFINPIDYQALKKNENEYNFDELLADISWFVHNCKIAHPRWPKLLKATNSLIDFVNNLIKIIEVCMGCFGNLVARKNGMTLQCGKEHPLVWAKSGENSFWPAKQLRVNEDSTIFVWYFGDYETDTVPANLCKSFAEKCPDDGCAAPLYKSALTVC